MSQPLVECVPNFSEGRDTAKIKQITEAIQAVSEVQLLDVDAGRDTNRTVVTFIGPPEAVLEAAFQAIAAAARVIDMRQHHGAHPRLGATDVCPFVPVEGISLEECAALAHRLGERVGSELEIPVYFYEAAARVPERKNLARIREGEYEKLAEKLADPCWKPDCGPARFNPKTGATVIGAREFLIAFNITLNTCDKAAATDIAFELREKGRAARKKTASPYYHHGEVLFYEEGRFPCGNCEFIGCSFAETEEHCRTVHHYELAQLLADAGVAVDNVIGQKVRRAGKFSHCKAIGWYVAEYRRAQISINLTNYHVTPPHLVLEEARRLAAERGLVVTGSEVVGMIPFRALLEAGKYYVQRQGGSVGQPINDLLQTAVFSMGLNDVQPFDVAKKVIGLPKRAENALIGMKLADFVDEVSRDTPAPGGGSIAALCGALGAALASMTANLAHNKAADQQRRRHLADLAEKAQALKDRLLSAVDEDSAAFNAYLQALRMPAETPEEQRVRQEKIAEGLKIAVEVPFRTAEAALEALQLARDMVHHGLAASFSDAAVGGMVAFAGVRGGVWNVLINLPQISDQQFVEEKRRQCAQLLADARSILQEIEAAGESRFPG